MRISDRSVFVTPAPPSPLSPREQELEARLQAAESRVLKAAVALIKRAKAEETVRQTVRRAAEEISLNGSDSLSEVVPFWNELSRSTQFKVSKMLNGDSPSPDM